MSPRRRRHEVVTIPYDSNYLLTREMLENPIATIGGVLLIGGIWFLSSLISRGELIPKPIPPQKIYTQSPQAQKLLVECREAVSKQGNDAAIDYCTRAIKLDPKFSEAYVVRGTAYAFLSYHDKRRINYEKDYGKALTLFQSQGYHEEAKSMKEVIHRYKLIAKLRKQNAQN